jgi:hypothetical protein
MKFYMLVVLVLLSTVASAKELILTSDSLGSLNLSKETEISISILKKHFPEYVVSHRIGEGDSPDFHLFQIKYANSEVVFTAISFINDESDRKKDMVKLDLIEIHSDKVLDEYGVNVGMELSDILKKRNTDLIFGANHHDNHIGLNNIWYALSTEDLTDPNGPDINPENVTLEDAKKHNLRVTSISWPSARW